MHVSLRRLVPIGISLAVSLLATARLQAQAQYAGTYVGVIGNKVTVPVVGSIEASVGGYIATVSADGSINLSNGSLTGTVSASGAVSFTGGSMLAQLGIRSATIANNQLRSEYGDVVANGTTQFRLLPSTSFTPAPGGGGGGGGGGGSGGGTIDTPDLAQAALRGKTLTFTTTDGAAPFPRTGTFAITLDATANTYTLTSLTSTLGNSSGSYTYDNFGNPNGQIELRFTNLIPTLEPLPVGLRVQGGRGQFEFNRGISAQGFMVGSFTIGTTPPQGGGGGGGGTTGGDLLAYYSFNDANNLLRDDSGRGFTLTPVNGTVTRIDGRVGAGALRTNGVRLRALVNSSFAGSAASISFFVRPTGAGTWNPRLVAVGPAGSSSHYYGAYLDGATTATRRLGFLQDGNGSYPPAYSTGMIATNNANTAAWVHVAVTHNGAEVRFYINGTLAGSASGRRALGTFSTAMLMIAGSDNNLDLFQGDLDEVRLFNRALTPEEVGTLNNGGSVGTAASGANTAAALPPNAIAAPVNLTGYRSRVGQAFELTLTGASSGSVWGTDVYTDDSNVARAAVHAGVVAVGETKTVTVTILPGQGSYAASSRNGVATSSWGAWGGSFSFAGSAGTTFTTVAAATPVALPAGYRTASLNVIPGGRLVFPITVTGTGPFSYQWFRNGTAIQGATTNPYIVNGVTAAHAGTYTVRVTNPAGTQTFTAGTLTVPPNANAPQIVLQPFDKVVAPGGTFALATSAVGSGITYQWFRNNVAIPAAAGGTGPILLRENADASDTGDYTVRLTGGGATVTSTAAAVAIDPNASRLSNLSGRIAIGGSDRVIPAVFIAGSGKKRVLIRAVGPGLGAFGVGGTMNDPKFEVYDGNTRIHENNDWAANIAAVFPSVGAFTLPAGSRDAASVVELDAGKGYTIHVFSNNSQGGIVLFEVYDLGNVSGGSKFTNVSVRGPTGTGDSTLILGLNIAGVGKRTLLTRGVGPQLAAFGVPSAIADPKLEIFDSNQRSVLVNNDWNSADFVSEMLQAREFVGAFALDGGSADASTLALLDPGSYTMQITAGSGTATGEALVEIYEVP